MTESIHGSQHFSVVGGIEINPDYADEWQGKNPDALLVQTDIRLVHPSERPDFDVLIGGIPCTSHSTMGAPRRVGWQARSGGHRRSFHTFACRQFPSHITRSPPAGPMQLGRK